MSAAEGMLNAPIATSCACAARSRASNAAPTTPVRTGFSSRSVSALPSRSSVPSARRSLRPFTALLASDILGRIRCERARASVPVHAARVSVGARATRRALSAAQPRGVRTARPHPPTRAGGETEAAGGRGGRAPTRGRAEHARRAPSRGCGRGGGANATRGALALSGLGARRARRPRETTPDPSPVPISRATIIDPVSVSAERQAQAWLKELDAERETLAATAVLNRVLYAHRIATADPHTHEVAPAQALVIRAGWGEGEQLADGYWGHALELPWVPSKRARRTRGRAAPPGAPRGAAGRADAGVALRGARAARAVGPRPGTPAHAAVELDAALAAALGELGAEANPALAPRLDELRALRAGVSAVARAVLPDASASDRCGRSHQCRRPARNRQPARYRRAARARRGARRGDDPSRARAAGGRAAGAHGRRVRKRLGTGVSCCVARRVSVGLVEAEQLLKRRILAFASRASARFSTISLRSAPSASSAWVSSSACASRPPARVAWFVSLLSPTSRSGSSAAPWRRRGSSRRDTWDGSVIAERSHRRSCPTF